MPAGRPFWILAVGLARESVRHGARVTGITLGQNPAACGNAALRAAGISAEQSRVLSMDYRDVPALDGGHNRYDAIVCLEMAEHVGIFKIVGFLRQCYEMLGTME